MPLVKRCELLIGIVVKAAAERSAVLQPRVFYIAIARTKRVAGSNIGHYLIGSENRLAITRRGNRENLEKG